MTKKLKTLSFVLAGAVTLCLCMGVNAFATDDNYSFAFMIKPYHANSRVESSGARYRETTDPKNMWKVGLRKSGEGSGTITNFWLEVYDETNVSGDISAKQGTKNYYKAAYETASQKNVYLTAENNGYDSIRYNVSGVWDEETGKYQG